jgi:ribonuclease Z
VGKNATLLIHEATFENDLIEDALEKRHSTTEEAVKVGERMNAHSVLLTHFSQRYPKVPIFTDDHGTVGISFDLMEVTIGDLYKLPKYVRADFQQPNPASSRSPSAQSGASCKPTTGL